MSGTLLVVAGAFVRDGRLLLTQRPERDPLAGFWELPGGKVEDDETPEEALAREWHEELGVEVESADPWAFASGAPNGRHVTLLVYLVRALRREPSPLGVAEIRWTTPEEAAQLPLLPADRPVVERLAREGTGRFRTTDRSEGTP
ncbi:MAG TPA: (deoxy)nucleoside triphosphate pyrophosphohydrolase [Thermoanaerobaculia bacterium]|nr:(deoxy)nucleoside triphosphate pyrophosphohydrolase [Thermoanaerobaculia bacterium]